MSEPIPRSKLTATSRSELPAANNVFPFTQHRAVRRPEQPASKPAAAEPLLRVVVGDVLREERLRQRRTLRDVSADAGVSMPYLSEIERGTKEASSEFIAVIGRALGLRLVDVAARTEHSLRRHDATNSLALAA